MRMGCSRRKGRESEENGKLSELFPGNAKQQKQICIHFKVAVTKCQKYLATSI